MNEIFILSLGVAGFAATTFIGYVFIRKQTNGKENENISRNQLEDAMKIKARQYEETC